MINILKISTILIDAGFTSYLGTWLQDAPRSASKQKATSPAFRPISPAAPSDKRIPSIDVTTPSFAAQRGGGAFTPSSESRNTDVYDIMTGQPGAKSPVEKLLAILQNEKSMAYSTQQQRSNYGDLDQNRLLPDPHVVPSFITIPQAVAK